MAGQRGERAARLLASTSRAPHVGKAGAALLAVLLALVLWAERSGAVPSIAAGFLAFAALTGILFLLCLYDLVVTFLEVRYKPAGSGTSERFRIASGVVLEYVRWLSPLGFVVGIVFGHYFWQ